MKKHAYLSLKDPEQLYKDIKSIKDETSMYMEKPKVNDLHSDGLNILEDVIDDIPNKDETSMNKLKDPHSDGLDETPGDEIDKKELKKILVLNNYKYTKKRKLGEAIWTWMKENDDEISQKLQHEYEQKLDLEKEIYEIIILMK